MSINLIDLFTKEFGGDVLGKVASALGEPEAKTQAAIGGLAPAVIGALANKATTTQGLGDLFDLMRTSGFDGAKPAGLASLLGGGTGLTDLITKGAPLAASLLGGRQSGVTDWLASMAGIGPRSSSSLLGLAMPVVMNLIGGQMRKGGGFNQNVLGELLGGQGQYLRDKAPAGLAAALGVPDFSKLGVTAKAAAPAPKVEYKSEPPKKDSGTNWLPWLLIPLLALLGWWWFANREPVGTLEPRIAIVNDEGKIVCSASVRDEATRDAILKALRGTFGEGTNCDVTIDRNIKRIAWLPNVDKVLAALKVPGTDFVLDGPNARLGGWLSAADRKRIMDELAGLFGTGYAWGDAADKTTEYIVGAKAKALAALTALGAAFSAEPFISAMNVAVINFATGSAEIPAGDQDLITQAATVLKTAPKGTIIEIGGHTDNTGDPAANQKLSEDRANAVRNALVAAGVDGAMIVAKGYGDTKPVASNDSEFGRFRNRRIEYSVVTVGTGK